MVPLQGSVTGVDVAQSSLAGFEQLCRKTGLSGKNIIVHAVTKRL